MILYHTHSSDHECVESVVVFAKVNAAVLRTFTDSLARAWALASAAESFPQRIYTADLAPS